MNAMTNYPWMTPAERRREHIWDDPGIKPIADEIFEKHGYRISLPDKLRGSWAFGYFNEEEKVVTVFMRSPDGRFRSHADIAFILAHELRHIQHFEQGLYREYYIEREERVPELMLVAIRAERDCDRYARERVALAFPTNECTLFNRTYPSWRVHPNYQPDGPRYYRWLMDQHFQTNYRRRLANVASKKLALG